MQSVYLFLAAAFFLLLFRLPYAQLVAGDGTAYTMGPGGFVNTMTGKQVFDLKPVLVLVALILVISLVNIFLYKNRIFQLRLCVFNMLLMVGMMILFAYYILTAKNQIDGTLLFRVPLLFPLFGVLFTWLAFRGIRKDEILIRSIDRLR